MVSPFVIPLTVSAGLSAFAFRSFGDYFHDHVDSPRDSFLHMWHSASYVRTAIVGREHVRRGVAILLSPV